MLVLSFVFYLSHLGPNSSVGILKATNWTHLLADLLVYSYVAELTQNSLNEDLLYISTDSSILTQMAVFKINYIKKGYDFNFSIINLPFAVLLTDQLNGVSYLN